MYIIDGEFAKIILKNETSSTECSNESLLLTISHRYKCVNQVTGKNSIAKIPKEMAKFLELPEPDTYTGHSYRRSATTIAADNGATIDDLKRLDLWKSNGVC